MHSGCREVTSEAPCPIVGGKVHLPASADQIMRKRLGRKQMAACAACGEQDRALRHYLAGTVLGGTRTIPIWVRFSGRLRVSASTMPIDMAMAICEDPP